MLAVHGSGGANVGAILKGHGLVLILNIGMGSNFHIAKIERLKNHDRGSGKLRGIQGVGQLYGTRGFFRSELYLSSHLGLFFTHQQGFPCGFVHQDTGPLVSLAGGQTRVGNRIHNGHFPGGNCCVLAVHGSGSANLRAFHKGDGLALVLDILMAGNLGFALEESFKNHYRFPCQSGAVEGVGQLHRPSRAGGSELQLGSNLLLVHQQRFARRFVHQYTRDFIGFAHLEIFISHSVHNSDFFGRFSCVLSVHRGRSADFRDALELVIDGAQVDGGVVAADGDVGNPHQLIPLIARARQLL